MFRCTLNFLLLATLAVMDTFLSGCNTKGRDNEAGSNNEAISGTETVRKTPKRRKFVKISDIWLRKY